MGVRSLLAMAVAVTSAMAQQSTSYVDSATGITFQNYVVDGWSFGIALPESPTTDFIGRLSGNTLDGYASVSLGGAMVNSLLVVAWANGDGVISQLREATGYANPTAYSDTTAGLYEISSGTSVNSTGFTYTFLCKNCITGDSATFTVDEDSDVFGYALSTTALTDTTDPSCALNFHSGAYGEYGINLAGAKSANYDTWAALASTTQTTTGSSSNSTIITIPQNTTTTTSDTTYDYIVAGAGAAGLIVAERLVEAGGSVLLIERGGPSTYSTGGNSTVSWNSTVTQYDVPAMAYYLTTASDTSEYCTDTASQAGCILGGSTMVNAMMFVKPQEADFDDKWPTGWKWTDVAASAERFYERSPGYILANGTGVDMTAFNVMSEFLDSNGWSQTNAIDNPNEKTNVYSQPPWLIQDGLRAGPVKSYLPLAQAKDNFKLSLNTKVVRAIRTNSTVSGVEVELANGNRQIININTGGKVILAGGALSTPRILFNSGIGPKAQIQTVQKGSVSVTLPDESAWIELPVGKNMMDHPIFTVLFDTKSTVSALPSTAFTSPNTTTIEQFATAEGLLAQSGQRLNFWTSVLASDGTTRYVQGTVNSPSNNTVRAKIYLTHGITSTGVLEITADGATEITTQPYLNTAEDKSAILAFMNNLINMTASESSPFSPLNDTAETLIASDNMVTGSHFVGTARMGATNDGTSVVDTNTKVWGMDNLYVVDASMHPDLPTGNTQAIIMVAAEHAAEKILADTTSASTSTVSAGSNSTVTTGPALASSSSKPKCSELRRRKAMLKRRAMDLV